MRKNPISILVWTCLLFSMVSLLARPAKPHRAQNLVLNKQRVDFRDLGYRPVNLIEPDDSKITSLITDPNSGMIYGATSGKRSQLFTFEPATNHVRPLGCLPSGGGVRNALVLAADGYLYLGTGKDMTVEPRISQDWGRELGHGHVFKKMWADIQAEYESYPGGHVYRFDPAGRANTRFAANQEANVEDLGIPVPGEGIYCMAASGDGKGLYGITYPGGKFFVFDLATARATVVGRTWEEVIFAGPRKGLRSLPCALIVGDEGNCYFSRDGGWIGRYSPESGKLETLKARLPGEFYTLHAGFGIYHPVVECWTKGARGVLYGGTNDGFLFKFIPSQERAENLGKVRITRRVRALATAADGRIYGVAGERHIGCTLFSYDPRNSAFDHHGPLEVDRSPYYAWNPYNFGAMTTGLDGTIYIGEEERKGHLFLFIPLSR